MRRFSPTGECSAAGVACLAPGIADRQKISYISKKVNMSLSEVHWKYIAYLSGLLCITLVGIAMLGVYITSRSVAPSADQNTTIVERGGEIDISPVHTVVFTPLSHTLALPYIPILEYAYEGGQYDQILWVRLSDTAVESADEEWGDDMIAMIIDREDSDAVMKKISIADMSEVHAHIIDARDMSTFWILSHDMVGIAYQDFADIYHTPIRRSLMLGEHTLPDSTPSVRTTAVETIFLLGDALFDQWSFEFFDTYHAWGMMSRATDISQERRMSLLATGDVMLDRSVYTHSLRAGDYGHPFVFVRDMFAGVDMRVANLEGAVTEFQSISNRGGAASFAFTFSPRTVEPLSQMFDLVSLANNHTNDFGQRGLIQTRAFLDEGGIAHVGDPHNDAEQLSYIDTRGGFTIGWIGYHQLVGHGLDRVVQEIEHIRTLVDLVIVLPHWGPEYVEHSIRAIERREAHALINAGADMIIGAHPHVVQPIEMYNGRPIFYSLGNFVFDQYFSTATMRGLVLGITLVQVDPVEEVSARVHLIPMRINTVSQVSLGGVVDRSEVLNHLATYSMVEESVRESLRQGVIEFVLPTHEVSDSGNEHKNL